MRKGEKGETKLREREVLRKIHVSKGWIRSTSFRVSIEKQRIQMDNGK